MIWFVYFILLFFSGPVVLPKSVSTGPDPCSAREKSFQMISDIRLDETTVCAWRVPGPPIKPRLSPYSSQPQPITNRLPLHGATRQRSTVACSMYSWALYDWVIVGKSLKMYIFVFAKLLKFRDIYSRVHIAYLLLYFCVLTS